MISLEELDTIVRFGKDTVSALYGVPVAFCHEVKRPACLKLGNHPVCLL